MKNILTFNSIADSLGLFGWSNGDDYPEHQILHFGAGFDDFMFLKNIHTAEKSDHYNYASEFINYINAYHGVDVNAEKFKLLDSELYPFIRRKNFDFTFKSMQDFLSDTDDDACSILITGIFDTVSYGDRPYDFILKTIEECFKRVSNRVVFTLKQKTNDDFEYNILYLFSILSVIYNKLVIKKFSDGITNQYIFSILK
jgi:hypothetical protein